MKYLIFLLLFLINCSPSDRIISLETNRGIQYFDTKLNFFCYNKSGKCKPPLSRIYYSDEYCDSPFIGGYESNSDYITYNDKYYTLGNTFSPTYTTFVYYLNNDNICLKTTLLLTSLRFVKEFDENELGDILK